MLPNPEDGEIVEIPPSKLESRNVSLASSRLGRT